MSIKEKIKNLFQYSNIWNKKDLEYKIKVFLEQIKNQQEILIKTISDFRFAHMSLVAGIIAFLWFLNKEKVTDFYLKWGILLLLGFVFFSIIGILVSYYYDYFILKRNIAYLKEYNDSFIKNKQQINTLDFSEEDAQQFNDKLQKFSLKDSKIAKYFIIMLYSITWLTLITWMILVFLFFVREFNLDVN